MVEPRSTTPGQLENTERNRVMEALAAEKERLAVTLRSIGDAVIATDEWTRVTILNRAAEELTGWKSEEAAGKTLREVFNIVNEETRQPALSPVDRVLREGVVVGLANHTALIARDGTERPSPTAPLRSATRAGARAASCSSSAIRPRSARPSRRCARASSASG